MKENKTWMLLVGLLILAIFIPGFFWGFLKIFGFVFKVAAIVIGVLLILAWFAKKK